MMNKPKIKQSHVANTKIGMGDYYGSGIKQRTAKARDISGFKEISPKKIKTPPKSLA